MSILKRIFTSSDFSDDSSNELAFDELFKEFYDRLVYFSFQFVKDNDQAQDIVQDAFVKYWNQHETVLQNKTAIKNYLYSTVRNASLNIVRHTKVVENYVLLNNAIEPEEPPVIEAMITAEVMSEIHSAVQSLPESYRVVSVLGYLDGKKNREIADELEMSVNTVKKQKQKAVQLLRMKLSPEMFILLLTIVLTAAL